MSYVENSMAGFVTYWRLKFLCKQLTGREASALTSKRQPWADFMAALSRSPHKEHGFVMHYIGQDKQNF